MQSKSRDGQNPVGLEPTESSKKALLHQTDTDSWLSQDSDGDGLSNAQEIKLGTDPYNRDTDRDSIADGDELANRTNPIAAEQAEEVLQSTEGRSVVQQPSIHFKSAQLEKDLPNQASSLHPQKEISNQDNSNLEQLSFIDTLYQKLWEHIDLNLDKDNVKLSIRYGSSVLYQGSFKEYGVNSLSPECENLLQQTLNDPAGLQGELAIIANNQLIFHVDNGKILLDKYGLASARQRFQAQPQSQLETASQQTFDAAALHSVYHTESQKESSIPSEQPSIENYERIAQKALSNGLSQEQVEQVLKQDPFHQNLALGIGQNEAERFTEHLLISLGSQNFADSRVMALESRVQNLESFNQYLSTQLDALSQKLELLNRSNAFQSRSSEANQILGNVRETISNTWQALKNALRQKAGEVSLSVIEASARASTQWFGEPAQAGMRVIEAINGKQMGMTSEGSISITKAPSLEAASQYQRLSQAIDARLPPSLQLKQIAQVALKEQFTTTQIHSILSEDPKYKEISATQGANKANQFIGVALAAAQRQNTIDAQPKQQQSQQQSQYQA